VRSLALQGYAISVPSSPKCQNMRNTFAITYPTPRHQVTSLLTKTSEYIIFMTSSHVSPHRPFVPPR